MNKMKRTAIAAAAGVAAAMAAVAVSSAPASAAPRDGRFWVFEHHYYGGAADWILSKDWRGGDPDLSNNWYLYGGIYMNDTFSSVANESGSSWCLYEHANYSGARMGVSPYSAIATLVPLGWNDKVSAAAPCMSDVY